MADHSTMLESEMEGRKPKSDDPVSILEFVIEPGRAGLQAIRHIWPRHWLWCADTPTASSAASEMLVQLPPVGAVDCISRIELWCDVSQRLRVQASERFEIAIPNLEDGNVIALHWQESDGSRHVVVQRFSDKAILDKLSELLELRHEFRSPKIEPEVLIYSNSDRTVEIVFGICSLLSPDMKGTSFPASTQFKGGIVFMSASLADDGCLS